MWKNDANAWMATDGFGDNTTATNTTSPSSEVSLSLCPVRALVQPAACGWAERAACGILRSRPRALWPAGARVSGAWRGAPVEPAA
jgi:hypothetical protein